VLAGGRSDPHHHVSPWCWCWYCSALSNKSAQFPFHSAAAMQMARPHRSGLSALCDMVKPGLRCAFLPSVIRNTDLWFFLSITRQDHPAAGACTACSSMNLKGLLAIH